MNKDNESYEREAALKKAEIEIEGMSCASCVKAITKALEGQEGVSDVFVNFASGRATVTYEPQRGDVERLLEAIHETGYEAYLAHDSAVDLSRLREIQQKDRFFNLFVAVLLTFPLVLQMVGDFLGIRGEIPRWIQLLLATIVQFWCGWGFYQGSYHALKVKSANMDLLIALGTSAAYFFSLFVVLLGRFEHLYFESSASIVTLVLLGRWMESQSKKKASEAVEKLLHLQPKMAKVERNGQFQDVGIEEIRIGDVFLVRPGENVPVDGIVVEGESAVNEAMLTGESFPVAKKEGAQLYSGTTNQNGVLKGRATGIGEETVLASIVHLVEKAQNSRAPIQRMSDFISGIFVPVVVTISLVTFFGWLIAGSGMGNALIYAVAVLIIACPCALGLATPTVIMVASGLAARFGILFREAAAIERSAKIRTIIFDKTGTLTEGKPRVVKVFPVEKHSEREIVEIAASLEHNSQHPLAQAIVEYASLHDIPIEPSMAFQSVAGRGVVATKRGKKYGVGSLTMAKETGVGIFDSKIGSLEQEGHTVCVVWSEEGVLGYLAITDQVRENALEMINTLKKMRIHPIMLTGDREKTADAVAKQMGIEEYLASILPDKKAEKVAELRSSGQIVGMVGDGINDAPALAAADVGFSLGAGSDVAIEASDVTLVGNDLLGVVHALELSQKSLKKIQQNLFFAFIYNILGIPLAAMGILNPVIAAAAMSMSSLSVVGNALALKNWQPKRRKR